MPPRDDSTVVISAVTSDADDQIGGGEERDRSNSSTTTTTNATTATTSSPSATSKPNTAACSSSHSSTTAKAVYFQNDPRPPLDSFMFELNVYSAFVIALLYYWTTTMMTSSTGSSYYYYYDIVQVLWKCGAAVVALDCAHYYSHVVRSRPIMECVPYTLPFVSITAMIVRPNRFWAELAGRAMRSGDGVCGTHLVPFTFLVFCTDPALCREILSSTDSQTFGVYAHPNAAWLFGPQNLIYMKPDAHKRFRALLTPALFSAEALALFAAAQERVVRQYLTSFVDRLKHHHHKNKNEDDDHAKVNDLDVRVHFRTMAAASSQESFLGPYLTAPDRAQLEADILTFTMGFLSFPLPYLPGGGLRAALHAKHRIERTLLRMVPLSRAYMSISGNAPRCMLDYWSQALLLNHSSRTKEEEESNVVVQVNVTDEDMARTVLDFLFAAQDATNSALASAMDVLDAHRDVVRKMRAEVDQALLVDNNCTNTSIAMAQTQHLLPYIGKVANQLLHHRPPVPMIPHIALKNTTLGNEKTRSFSIGKGVVAIPNITYSARTSGHALQFHDPDLVHSNSDLDPMFVKVVTFGGGPHKCPGRRYADTLLQIFLAVLAHEYDWHRPANTVRPTEDEFIYFPTVFPRDTRFVITPRGKSESE